MVHDEAGTVGPAIETIKPFCDPVIALDVGSSDGAVDIARDLGAEIHEQEWTTHGAAAMRLFDLARGRADYVYLASATETVEQVGTLPARLRAPLYVCPTVRDGLRFQTERLFDLKRKWSCDGPVHTTISPYYMDERRELDALVITQHDDGRRDDKLHRYRLELEAWLKDNPRDTRSIFYLAQTYANMGALHAASGVYQRRAQMTQGDEEAWYSLYQAARCELNFNFETGAKMLLAAFLSRPGRMEPLLCLEDACRQIRAQVTAPPPGEILFIEPEAYG